MPAGIRTLIEQLRTLLENDAEAVAREEMNSHREKMAKAQQRGDTQAAQYWQKLAMDKLGEVQALRAAKAKTVKPQT